jgi:hypothetical protein
MPSVASGAAPSCYAALGVTSVTASHERRRAARETWIASPNVGRTLCVSFLLRGIGMPAPDRRVMDREAQQHGDVLFLPVSASEGPITARLASMFAWLQLAPRQHPSASWICKADDDVYLLAPEWEAQLRLIDASRQAAARAAGRAPGEDAILHGKLMFHNLDTRHRIPTTFDFSFNDREWPVPA